MVKLPSLFRRREGKNTGNEKVIMHFTDIARTARLYSYNDKSIIIALKINGRDYALTIGRNFIERNFDEFINRLPHVFEKYGIILVIDNKDEVKKWIESIINEVKRKEEEKRKRREEDDAILDMIVMYKMIEQGW